MTENTEDEIKILKEELEQFQKERNDIRNIIGSIGGKISTRRDRFFNICFIVVVVIIFILDTMRYTLRIAFPLPPLFSIEIGLLLVSIKIIWMIHKQMKVEHFQFWILNSIEYRINDISKKMKNIEDEINDHLTNKSP